MVALSASRLVCSAIAVISLMTSPMRLAACESSPMRASVRSAWRTASIAIPLDSCTWRLISAMDVAISSVALATDCTLVEESSEAVATAEDSCCVVSAVLLIVPAAASSSTDVVDTMSTILPTAASNSSASLRMAARCSAARRGALVGGLAGDCVAAERDHGEDRGHEQDDHHEQADAEPDAARLPHVGDHRSLRVLCDLGGRGGDFLDQVLELCAQRVIPFVVDLEIGVEGLLRAVDDVVHRRHHGDQTVDDLEALLVG